MPFTSGDDNLGFWGCIEEVEKDFPLLLSIGVGFSDGFKFHECLLIIKGILFKPPWILGRDVSLVQQSLIVKSLDICTAHVVVVLEEVIPGFHTIVL